MRTMVTAAWGNGTIYVGNGGTFRGGVRSGGGSCVAAAEGLSVCHRSI